MPKKDLSKTHKIKAEGLKPATRAKRGRPKKKTEVRVIDEKSASPLKVIKANNRDSKTTKFNALADSILNQHAAEYIKYMNDLWDDEKTVVEVEVDEETKEAKEQLKRVRKSEAERNYDRKLAANFYLQTIEYFKPKMARIENKVTEEREVTVRIVNV